jgi:hypothetical protein
MKTDVRITQANTVSQAVAQTFTPERLRTLIQDCHINFLFGAGSSAPFFSVLGDIETLLTELSDPDPKTQQVRASVQAYFHDKVIAPNLELLEGTNPDAVRLIKSWARFLSTVNQLLLKRRSTLLSKQANLFTTNVDLAMERAMELLEIECNDGFKGKIRPRLDLAEFGTIRLRQGTRYEYRSEIPVINLFKIHGSVNWIGGDAEIYFDHKLEIVTEVNVARQAALKDLVAISKMEELIASMLKNKATGVFGEAMQKFDAAYRKLLIVNPEKTKFKSTVLNKTYYELLRRFANELEKENSVLIVHGFSFRDEHLLDLVLRAAATNPTLQVITFCYDRKAHTEISKMFPQEKVRNGNILLVQPAMPENTDEKKMTLEVLAEDWLVPMLSERPAVPDSIIELKLGLSDKSGANA